MSVELTLINKTTANDLNIVIFQKNMASRASDVAVAWKVFANCPPKSKMPFVFSDDLTVNASDSFGNITPMLVAEAGQLFDVYPAERRIAYVGPTVNTVSIQLCNVQPIGNINANLYRGGALLSVRNIAPAQKAVFEFVPTLWVGIIPGVVAGQAISPMILPSIGTQLSLAGLVAADLVLTGGVSGEKAHPFKFALKNTVPAP